MKRSKKTLAILALTFCSLFFFAEVYDAYAHGSKFHKKKGHHHKKRPRPSGAPEPQMIYLLGMAGLASTIYLHRKKLAKKSS